MPPLPVEPGEKRPPVALLVPLGEKLGAGAELFPEPEEPLFEPEPVFEPVIGPPEGPATFGAATFGTGMLKLLFGLLTFGALGFNAGLGATAGALGWP